MASKKCPDCGSQSFYIKDPEDQFNLFEFDYINGNIISSEQEEESLEVTEDSETYCDRCAWHDKFKVLK